jgi:hypothetical protein
MVVNFATSSGRGFRVQVALGRGQLRVAHHVLDGAEVELLDREAAEGVSQVEAAHSDAGLFLGTDEAAADRGAIEACHPVDRCCSPWWAPPRPQGNEKRLIEEPSPAAA